MLVYYGARTLAHWVDKTGKTLKQIQNEVQSSLAPWENVGGQLVPEKKVDKLRFDVANGVIKSWDEMHSVYKQWGTEYELDQLSNSLGVLKKCLKIDYIDEVDWTVIKNRAKKTRIWIENQVFETKVKDYNNPYRDITYRDHVERDIVLGAVEENPFVTESSNITRILLDQLNSVKYE
jgi:hypothetical protein